jgi:hypothetical protein
VRKIILVLLLAMTAMAQMKSGLDEHAVYHNAEHRFSFTPPGGMKDVTAKANASAVEDPNAIQLLLFELSGPNGEDLDWHALAVQSYPRAQVSAQNDFEAELRLSRTVIGSTAKEAEAPRRVTVGDLTYAVSQFQRTHGAVTEHSRVYATTIGTQMIAFVFSANSEATVESMAQSLKTLHVKKE